VQVFARRPGKKAARPARRRAVRQVENGSISSVREAVKVGASSSQEHRLVQTGCGDESIMVSPSGPCSAGGPVRISSNMGSPIDGVGSARTTSVVRSSGKKIIALLATVGVPGKVRLTDRRHSLVDLPICLLVFGPAVSGQQRSSPPIDRPSDGRIQRRGANRSRTNYSKDAGDDRTVRSRPTRRSTTTTTEFLD